MSEASRALGVSRASIREWRDGGAEHGGRPHACFRCNSVTPSDVGAYSALLGFYLGDGCVSEYRGKLSLRVSCDQTYPGIIEDVTSVMQRVRGDGRVGHVPAPGVTVVRSWWQHWPCLFPQHGPGRKHERKLTLEPWQQHLVQTEPAAFLRGLFHSDGCRVKNWATRPVAGELKRYDYPRWQFVNCSEDILGFCTDALDAVGVPWRRSNHKTVSVSRREAVARLDDLIGLKR